MTITREDIERIASLNDFLSIFKKQGFTDFSYIDENEIRIALSEDSMESVLVIKMNPEEKISDFYNRINNIDIIFLNCITEDFEVFTIVKKTFTFSGREKYQKIRFSKKNISHLILTKFNELQFGDLGSFESFFDKREVIKKFYQEFINYRSVFMDHLKDIENQTDRVKFAQLVFNRMIFLYFIQKKGFLNKEEDFLQKKLQECQAEKRNFYQSILQKLFFEILGSPSNNKDLGEIPYLNGGLFRKAHFEKKLSVLLPNTLFQEILDFFDSYHWYIDERADYGEERGLSPEILGHIFEQSINLVSNSSNAQHETGSFYTPEIVTDYMTEKALQNYILTKIAKKFNKNFKNFLEILSTNNSELIQYTLFKILPNITILDNACGSGAFLLSCLKILLSFYDMIFENLKTSESTQKIFQEFLHKYFPFMETSDDLIYQLSIFIISNNIFGVDINNEAIEIAKLRLWLAIISNTSISSSKVDPLPNIEYNVLEGNSLIGYEKVQMSAFVTPNYVTEIRKTIQNFSNFSRDFKKELLSQLDIPNLKKLVILRQILIQTYKTNRDPLLSEEFRIAIKKISIIMRKYFTIQYQGLFEENMNITNFQSKTQIFHWIMEFPQIFVKKNAGFSVIIGNPPYINNKELPDTDKKYYKKIYTTAKGQFDLFSIFIERSINLLEEEGEFHYIIPDAFINRKNFKKIRKYVVSKTKINQIIKIKDVFQDPSVANSILSFSNQRLKKYSFSIYDVDHLYKLSTLHKARQYFIDLDMLAFFPDYKFILLEKEELPILRRILDFPNLGKFIDIHRGEEYGKSKLHAKPNAMDSIILPGQSIQRFAITQSHYIEPNQIKKGDLYHSPKIMIKQLGKRIFAALDYNENLANLQSVYNIHSADPNLPIELILGYINSNFVHWIYAKIFRKPLFPRIVISDVKLIPFLQITNVDSNTIERICIIVQIRLFIEKVKIEKLIENTEFITLVERIYNMCIYYLVRKEEDKSLNEFSNFLELIDCSTDILEGILSDNLAVQNKTLKLIEKIMDKFKELEFQLYQKKVLSESKWLNLIETFCETDE